MFEEKSQKTYDGTLRKLSEEEVRSTYADNFKELAKTTDMLKDCSQKIGTLPVRARLIFDSARNVLSQIDLTAKDPFEHTAGDALALSVAAVNVLDRNLTEKYGKPTTEKGECNLTVRAPVKNRALSCDKMWSPRVRPPGCFGTLSTAV